MLLSAKDENDGFDNTAPQADGSIRFENVGFSYTGEGLAIAGITATVKAGETVAFIGGTGSGKSTLVRLLCGLDRPTEGEIYFGEEKLSQYAPEKIRQCISCVRQRDVVFSGTLQQSVDSEAKHTEEEVISALFDGQMQDFIEDKEEGIGYGIGERPSHLTSQVPSAGNPGFVPLLPSHPAHIMATCFYCQNLRQNPRVRRRTAFGCGHA